MNILELLLLAIALAMDTFAAGVCIGLSAQKQSFKAMLTSGMYFGLSQALMPVFGYFAGIFFARYIMDIDHWVVFCILSFIGGKMLWESRQNADCGCRELTIQARVLLPLALATSIDAMAVGISFAFLQVNLWLAVCLIGIVTFVISAVGVKIGSVFGSRYRVLAERLGGVVLILIGVKVLVEHLI